MFRTETSEKVRRAARKRSKRGHKPLFDPAIFEERFRTIERLFAWEDTH